jgi:hypothetical protein
MSSENFIISVLNNPTDTIAYSVSKRLAELYPERAVLEGEESAFDVLEFARAGQCKIVDEPHVYNQTRIGWHGAERPLERATVNAWFNVLWEGRLLDVVYLTWHDEGYRTRFFWISAESRDVGERFFRTVCDWCSEVRGEVLVFDSGYWKKDERLYAAIRGTTFDTLVLPAALEAELRGDVARFFASRDLYGRYGVAWRRGVLLVGPPGNGKTHAVKAVVNTTEKPCLYVKSFHSRNDTVQGNMHDVFERARRAAPCVLVLEDLDSLVDAKSRAFFLNELDGFAPNSGIFTLATTNYPEKIDPAIVDRPGRFDRKYAFELPAETERVAFVARWNAALEPEMRASEGGVCAAARATEGYSFAYLKELVVSSMTEWLGSSGAASMDAVLARRAAALRTELAHSAPAVEEDEEDEDD